MPDCFWKVETILPSTKEEAGLAFGSNLPISLKLGKHPVFFFFFCAATGNALQKMLRLYLIRRAAFTGGHSCAHRLRRILGMSPFSSTRENKAYCQHPSTSGKSVVAADEYRLRGSFAWPTSGSKSRQNPCRKPSSREFLCRWTTVARAFGDTQGRRPLLDFCASVLVGVETNGTRDLSAVKLAMVDAAEVTSIEKRTK